MDQAKDVQSKEESKQAPASKEEFPNKLQIESKLGEKLVLLDPPQKKASVAPVKSKGLVQMTSQNESKTQPAGKKQAQPKQANLQKTKSTKAESTNANVKKKEAEPMPSQSKEISQNTHNPKQK